MGILIHLAPGHKRWQAPLVLAALVLVVDSISLADDAGAVEPRFEITSNEYMLIKPVDGSPMSGLDQVEKYYVDLIHAIAER